MIFQRRDKDTFAPKICLFQWVYDVKRMESSRLMHLAPTIVTHQNTQSLMLNRFLTSPVTKHIWLWSLESSLLELVSINRFRTCAENKMVAIGKEDSEPDIDTTSSLDWKESGDSIWNQACHGWMCCKDTEYILLTHVMRVISDLLSCCADLNHFGLCRRACGTCVSATGAPELLRALFPMWWAEHTLLPYMKWMWKDCSEVSLPLGASRLNA